LASDKKKAATQKEPAVVTRISARDTAKQKQPVASALKTKIRLPKRKRSSGRRGPLRATIDYFAGAWYELRQVHWPTRRATWSMTGALLGFTAFFVVVILILDAAFKYLFQLILK